MWIPKERQKTTPVLSFKVVNSNFLSWWYRRNNLCPTSSTHLLWSQWLPFPTNSLLTNDISNFQYTLCFISAYWLQLFSFMELQLASMQLQLIPFGKVKSDCKKQMQSKRQTKCLVSSCRRKANCTAKVLYSVAYLKMPDPTGIETASNWDGSNISQLLVQIRQMAFNWFIVVLYLYCSLTAEDKMWVQFGLLLLKV